jgi:hypothetical protein
MIAELSPGLILIIGGLLAPLLPARLRPFLMIILPFVAFAHLVTLPDGELGRAQMLGLSLITLRVDKLSLMFGYVFLLAAFLGGLYALHVRDSVQQSAGLIYAGSAIGAIFAGDLVTLFIFWEGIAIGSVFLIWASRNERAYRAGMRYFVIHPARLRHQVRVSAAAQLAAGRLSGSDRYWHGVALVFHHKSCSLCTRARVRGDGNFGADRRSNDGISNFLCSHRKRSAARAGL